MVGVVLDTNIVLSSISSKSPFHNILKFLFNGYYELFVTTEILLEYEEKITANFDAALANTFLSALLIRSNVKKIEVYFDLNLIDADKEDNKFVNCAFASNAHFIVTNDKHFNILRKIEFPVIGVMNIEEFNNLLTHSASTTSPPQTR